MITQVLNQSEDIIFSNLKKLSSIVGSPQDKSIVSISFRFFFIWKIFFMVFKVSFYIFFLLISAWQKSHLWLQEYPIFNIILFIFFYLLLLIFSSFQNHLQTSKCLQLLHSSLITLNSIRVFCQLNKTSSLFERKSLE